MYEGKAAIHMAVVESYLPIVRLLIEYQADLNVKVSYILYVHVHVRVHVVVHLVYIKPGGVSDNYVMDNTC